MATKGKSSKPSSTSNKAKASSKQAALAKAQQAKAGKQQPAPAPTPTVVTKLTKRSKPGITNTTVFVFGAKLAPNHTKPHTKDAWAAVATALNKAGKAGVVGTDLLGLAPLAAPGCVSPQAFLSYCVRRGWVAPKA